MNARSYIVSHVVRTCTHNIACHFDKMMWRPWRHKCRSSAMCVCVATVANACILCTSVIIFEGWGWRELRIPIYQYNLHACWLMPYLWPNHFTYNSHRWKIWTNRHTGDILYKACLVCVYLFACSLFLHVRYLPSIIYGGNRGKVCGQLNFRFSLIPTRYIKYSNTKWSGRFCWLSDFEWIACLIWVHERMCETVCVYVLMVPSDIRARLSVMIWYDNAPWQGHGTWLVAMRRVQLLCFSIYYTTHTTNHTSRIHAWTTRHIMNYESFFLL